METFLYSLAATAIATLAWLAYSHSADFDRIAKVMLSLSVIIQIAYGCWVLGQGSALSEIGAAVPELSNDILSQMTKTLYERWILVFLIGIGFQAYVMLLWSLPNFLTLPKAKKE